MKETLEILRSEAEEEQRRVYLERFGYLNAPKKPGYKIKKAINFN